ncbi:MAG: extracellular solute-binding protein [Cephaloticoccus sp.]|nr:extracellular solute-binding protein [Cephaloticoccus sp.]
MAVKTRKLTLGVLIAAGAYLAAMLMVMTRPGSALSGDQRTVIRFAHWQIEAGPREAVDALIKRYEEIHPEVRVEHVAVPGRIYKQWLRTQLIGGSAPDIIEFGSFFGGVEDIPPRFFEPISELVEQPNPYNRGTPLEGMRWRDTFLDGLITADTYIENLSNFYAVTLCMLSTRLFYNPVLLEEISGSPDAPTTFTEVQALSEKLARRNATAATPISLYAGSLFNGNIIMEQMISRAGIGLTMSNDRLREQGQQARDLGVSYLRGDWSYRDPAMLSGMERMREVAQDLRPGFQQLERDAAVLEFLRGQALMIVTGTWDVTSLTSLAPFKIAAAEFPWPTMADGAVGRYYWSPVSEGAGNTSMPLYLNRKSAHKKEAVDFLHFITSVEGNTLFFQQSGWLPSIREVVVPEEAQVYLPRFEGLPIRTSMRGGFGPETRELWLRQLHHLISAHGSVEEFMQAFEPEFSTALRRDLSLQVRNMFLTLRHETPALTALATLDRLQHPVATRVASRQVRESSQHITEARLYEALAVLAREPEPAAKSEAGSP